MRITLSAAISGDGFLCNLTSLDDRAQFTAWLKSDETDAFVMGRKTFEEFRRRLPRKPIFVLSREHRANHGLVRYVKSIAELPQDRRYALLGGAQIYELFLIAGIVDRARITVEKKIRLGAGLPLDFEKFAAGFAPPEITPLSNDTDLLVYANCKALAPPTQTPNALGVLGRLNLCYLSEARPTHRRCSKL